MCIDGKDKKPAIKKGVSPNGDHERPKIKHNPLEMRRYKKAGAMFFCKGYKSNKKNKD